MKRLLLLSVLVVFVCSVGCSTTATFKVPEGSQLQVTDREAELDANGNYKTSPFFWSNAGGIPYKVVKNGEVIREGKLQSRFRVASIFWPPFALIYWPMGFGKQTYDLTKPDGAVPAAAVPETAAPTAPAKKAKKGKK